MSYYICLISLRVLEQPLQSCRRILSKVLWYTPRLVSENISSKSRQSYVVFEKSELLRSISIQSLIRDSRCYLLNVVRINESLFFSFCIIRVWIWSFQRFSWSFYSKKFENKFNTSTHCVHQMAVLKDIRVQIHQLQPMFLWSF